MRALLTLESRVHFDPVERLPKDNVSLRLKVSNRVKSLHRTSQSQERQSVNQKLAKKALELRSLLPQAFNFVNELDLDILLLSQRPLQLFVLLHIVLQSLRDIINFFRSPLLELSETPLFLLQQLLHLI